MENSVNNNLNGINNEQLPGNSAESFQVTSPEHACVSAQPQEPQASFTPTYAAPVYSNQYPPQYVPGQYTAPCYTPPVTPYNQGYVNTQAQPYQSPSTIYNNTQHGAAPQYHYGAPMMNVGFNNAYYEEQQKKNFQRKKEEKKIRNIGNVSGALLIASMIVAFLFSVAIVTPSVYDFYNSGLSAQCFINMIYTLVVVGATFLFFSRFFKQHSIQQSLETGGIDGYAFKIKFSAPKNKLKATLLVIISFGGCMLANYISSIILTILEGFGLYSTYSSIEEPRSTVDLILMCISVAVLPALVEEFALRGVLMSSLRRYGNTFAIITSAFVFGIFHGDAAQIPFAFVCGLFFAYIVIATDSIWPAIIVHAMNNSLSCISSVITQVADEETANIFFYAVSIGGIVLAFGCLFIYVSKYTYILKPWAKDEVGADAPNDLFDSRLAIEADNVFGYKGDANILSIGQKLKKYFTSPAMIIAVFLYILQSFATLTTKG